MAEVSGFQAAAPLAARILAAARGRAFADGVQPVARPDVDLVEVAGSGHAYALNRPLKVLGRGEAGKAFTVRAHKFSGRAAEKIKAAGGQVEAIA